MDFIIATINLIISGIEIAVIICMFNSFKRIKELKEENIKISDKLTIALKKLDEITNKIEK